MVPSALPASMAVVDEGQRNGLSANAHSQLRLSASGPSWKDIQAAQRQVLMPLRDHWDNMGALTKRRWLVLADRYPQMDEGERTKLVSRMHTWASLSAQQRTQARLNFANAKRLSPQDLQAKWEEYRALSEAEKARLAEQARKTKASAAKKAKRRLARIPASGAAPRATPPAPTSTPVAPPVDVPQVRTPSHAPSLGNPPSPSDSSDTVATPTALSLPITLPQAIPTLELAPLPPAAPHAPVAPTSSAQPH